MKRICLALLLALSSFTAFAGGTASTVTITYIQANSGTNVWVVLSSNLSGGPSCANGFPNGLVIDTSTAGGRAQLAVAMNYYVLQKQLTVKGGGVCGSAPDSTGVETFYQAYATN